MQRDAPAVPARKARTVRYPFPKPVRRQLCREIGKAMRSLREFI